MTAEPKWLTMRMVLAIHDEQLAVFGGAPGLRDPGLLDSAPAKARNRYAYERDAGIFRLAAAYCTGIVRNHPFVDGNKRTGLLAARAFLFRNDYLLEPEEPDEVAIIVALAEGEIDEAVLAAWIAENASPRDQTFCSLNSCHYYHIQKSGAVRFLDRAR